MGIFLSARQKRCGVYQQHACDLRQQGWLWVGGDELDGDHGGESVNAGGGRSGWATGLLTNRYLGMFSPASPCCGRDPTPK